MFTGGMGWGEIARQLKISAGSGIGWIMGGGHGNGHANGKGTANGNTTNEKAKP